MLASNFLFLLPEFDLLYSLPLNFFFPSLYSAFMSWYLAYASASFIFHFFFLFLVDAVFKWVFWLVWMKGFFLVSDGVSSVGFTVTIFWVLLRMVKGLTVGFWLLFQWDFLGFF